MVLGQWPAGVLSCSVQPRPLFLFKVGWGLVEHFGPKMVRQNGAMSPGGAFGRYVGRLRGGRIRIRSGIGNMLRIVAGASRSISVTWSDQIVIALEFVFSSFA